MRLMVWPKKLPKDFTKHWMAAMLQPSSTPQLWQQVVAKALSSKT
jgi:hypothetical protein